MAQKLCVYCHKVVLEGFDETERKYYEKGSRTLHTRERCEAAKQGAGPAGQGQSQELAELITKVDKLIEQVTNLNNRISGQGSLDIET